MEQARELASSIKGASLITLDTDNQILRANQPATEVVTERIKDFLACLFASCIDEALQTGQAKHCLRCNFHLNPR